MSGEGSVYPRRDRDGRIIGWIAQQSIGPRGHRRYVRRMRPTKREAREALVELNDDRRAGRQVSKLNLGAYLRTWLDNSVRPKVGEHTFAAYGFALAHLAPIADIPLEQLQAEDIEACCNAMTARRGKAAVPLAPKYVRNIQVMLREALGQAEQRGHVRRNVARLVPLRRVPRRHHDALTPARAREVLAAVEGDRYEAAVALGFAALRLAEVLGLGWEDVDLEAGTVTVRWQLVRSGPAARRTSVLKTDGSTAIVPLPAFVVERLEAHRRRQLEERPVASLDGGLVFVTPHGYAVSGSWLTKHFQQKLADAGLPRMRFHDLRHGAATLLAGAGTHPRIAQELLRHAPGSRVTMDVYTHVTAGQQREAADVLERVING